jgi:hypothetical protein
MKTATMKLTLVPGSATMNIVKWQKPAPAPDVNSIVAYWLMYCRAPGRKTAPGEPVDLGEIGADVEKNWSRLTPYSPSQKER